METATLNIPADWFNYRDPLPAHLLGMTQALWDRLTPAEREAQRDNSHMTSQLIGLEGCRVEVLDASGERRRFIVGRSTGWRPCHLEIKSERACSGDPARSYYQTVTKLERVR
jgi:hypothetical protein